MRFHTNMPAAWKGLQLKWLAIFVALMLLMGCVIKPNQPPTTEMSSDKAFQVPRRSDPLTPEQEKVRQQVTDAVEADIDSYLGNYIERMTEERDKDGRLVKPGTRDIITAMRQGPLVISADDMRSLFPQYAASRASRSIHSQSVHESVTAMAAELYRRALLVDDPRGNNTVLFTAGGVASGKTTAINTIDDVHRVALAAQIIYDGTMRGYEKSRRRVMQALEAGKLVGVVYVLTPIEKSTVWLVNRAIESGRVVQADAAGRSHWQAQHTFLQLLEEFQSNPSISFRLIDKSGETAKTIAPATMKTKLYADDDRFTDMAAFITYTKELIRTELEKAKANGRLIPETEQAFKAEE